MGTLLYVVACLAAAWVIRPREDDGGWGGGGSPKDDQPNPPSSGVGRWDPIEWEAFDHARDTWESHEPVSLAGPQGRGRHVFTALRAASVRNRRL
jgi:hypothetical protein